MICFLTATPFDLSLPNKTIVVSGIARGGTSMLSLVLRGLGVPMGRDLDRNHEDIEFYSALNSDPPDIHRIVHLAKERSEEFEIWGFKSPLLIEKNVVSSIIPTLRNPLLIIVFRNVIGNILSFAHRDGIEYQAGLQKNSEFLRTVESLMMSANYPILGVSYEDAASNPIEFTSRLAQVLGVDVETEVIVNAASLISGLGGGYRFLPEENRTISLVNANNLQDTLEEIPCDINSGLVVILEDCHIYYGDVFDGDQHLIKFLPMDEISFGCEIYIRPEFENILHDAHKEEKDDRSLNIYIRTGKDYSLGSSFTLVYKDVGSTYHVRTSLPIQGLAVGISNGQDKGRRSPAVSLRLFASRSLANVHLK